MSYHANLGDDSLHQFRYYVFQTERGLSINSNHTVLQLHP